MNENIDLTKILKDYPKGIKLYSTIYGEVEFDKIKEENIYSIIFTTKRGNVGSVTSDGKHHNDFDGDCTLFPSKEQRDWSKFTAPWYKKEMDNIAWLEEHGKKSDDKIEPKFKVGDWIVNKFGDSWHIDSLDKKNYQVSDEKGNYNYFSILKQDEIRLWTIQDANDGDILAAHECYVIFKEIDGLNIKCYCTYHYLGFKPGLYRDTVQNKNAFLPATKEQHDAMMKAMNDAGYKWNAKTKTLEELIKPKFDPKTLNPFEKVLVRDSCAYTWRCAFYSHTRKDESVWKYITGNSAYEYCIPYNNDTKHLIGTTDEAPEYYRYWEK